MGQRRPAHGHDRRTGIDISASLRVEDLLITGWVAIASPLLFRLSSDKGPFDPGQPVEGLLRLGAVVGVLACLAARRKTDGTTSLSNWAAVGPFVGGLLLVTISGFTALRATNAAIYVGLLAAAILMVAVRFVVPPLDTRARRVLVAPFVLVAGGLYWSFIEAVSGTRGAPLFFLIAFSAIYYAMLIYAPRQVAEREGGGLVWLLRYVVFAVSIALGMGWLSILTT
jgi:hypothetical protein